MNADRRKRISALMAELERAISIVDELRDGDAEALKDEERESFDNLSEGLQQSERGQQAEAAAEALESAYDAIDEASTAIQSALDYYEEASQ